MTVNLGSIPRQVIIQGTTNLDVSQALISLSINGNALDDSGWFKPRGQIVLGVLSGFSESFDCRVNPGRWAPGTIVAVSVWFGAWIPLPWRLRILAYPNRPMPGNQQITLEVGTDADLLNYRAPEGDPGTDEYGTPAGATTLINRALSQAGAPSLTDTITTLSLPFSPAKTTSGSWMTYAGSVAYAARHILWQQTDGTIRATPLTLDGLTPIATYTVGTDEADYVLSPPGEQPPEIVEVQGTTYRIESAEPEDTDVTEVVNGVTTRTRVEFKDWNTASPQIIETVWIPLELIAPPAFEGNTGLSLLKRTTTTRNYDAWDRLTSTEIKVEQPLFILAPDDPSLNNQVYAVFNQTTTTNIYPLSFSSDPDLLRQIKTSEVILRRETVEQVITEIPNVIPRFQLRDRIITVETWDKNGPEQYLYRRVIQDNSEERLNVPAQPTEARFAPPPATEFKPAAKQRTELERRGQARFTNAVGSSFAEKKWIITLPSGMGTSADQCRAHAALWGRVRQGRQFPIKWAADISAAWLQNWSPVRRVDFTLGGVTTAYLVEAFNIQIDQRSAAVGGLAFELGRTTAGIVTDPPYTVVPEAFIAGAIGGLSMAAEVEVLTVVWHQASVGGLSFAAIVEESAIDATHAASVSGLSMAANVDPTLSATYAASVDGLTFGASLDDHEIAMFAANVEGLTFAASAAPIVGVTHAANVGGLVFAASALSIAPEILWLEADFGVTLTSGAVSAWADRSTNAYSFTQGSASNRPTVVAAALNGNPVLRFDGGDWLSMATTLLNTSGATANIYVVSDHRGGTDGALVSTRSSAINNGWTLRYNSATQLLYFHTGSSPTISRTIVDGYRLIEVQRNGLSVALGDSGTLPSPTTISGLTTSSIGTWVGVETQGIGSNPLNGDIAAIIIATSNRSGILSYLQTKYGV